jgi:hypothetical protein
MICCPELTAPNGAAPNGAGADMFKPGRIRYRVSVMIWATDGTLAASRANSM